jgi:hypothetical protein
MFENCVTTLKETILVQGIREGRQQEYNRERDRDPYDRTTSPVDGITDSNR